VPHLTIVEPEHATGELAEVYARMRARKMNPAYTPSHGGVPGIIRAHSLDPALMPRVFAVSGVINGQGPLPWHDRELVAAATSILNQCFY
jgi:hypothetical protein